MRTKIVTVVTKSLVRHNSLLEAQYSPKWFFESIATMDATPLTIPDIWLFTAKMYRDERGFFFESFKKEDFEHHIQQTASFVQDNYSYSYANVLRGLHYQLPTAQGKLVRVLEGTIFDVVVDIRRASTSFGKWLGIELSHTTHQQLWIPPGFAHGFLVTSHQGAHILYKTTTYHYTTEEYCILWNDITLGIRWPLSSTPPLLSKKDQQGLSFHEAPYHDA